MGLAVRHLQGVAFPPWLWGSVLALFMRRTVRVAVLGRLGRCRVLARSIGMGGAAGPPAWNLAYDPIVEALAATTGAPAPTFIDDLASRARWPVQAVATQLFLLAAGRATGLLARRHA